MKVYKWTIIFIFNWWILWCWLYGSNLAKTLKKCKRQTPIGVNKCYFVQTVNKILQMKFFCSTSQSQFFPQRPSWWIWCVFSMTQYFCCVVSVVARLSLLHCNLFFILTSFIIVCHFCPLIFSFLFLFLSFTIFWFGEAPLSFYCYSQLTRICLFDKSTNHFLFGSFQLFLHSQR